MPDRDVGRPARLHRQADPDQVGAHRVERVGFGVEGDQLGRCGTGDPGLQLLSRQHRLVLARGRQRRVERGGRFAGRCLGVTGGGAPQAHVRIAGCRWCCGGTAELLQRLGEAIAQVQLAQHRHVRVAQRQGLRSGVQRHIGADGDQLAVQRQALQRGAQVLADLALHARRGGHHPVQVLVLGQPLGGGLGTALLHARDVVHGVAHQRQQVDDLVGAHAELLHHRRVRVHPAAGHGVDQFDARADQLGEVLVAGGNGDRHALAVALQGQGADHIVGFHAGNAQDGQAQRLDDLAHGFDLGAQVVRHRRTVGLVVGIQIVTEGLAGGVDHEGHVLRALLQGGAQHVDHAEQRAGGFTGRVGQRRKRVERAIQVTGPVNQD